jgi:predicted Fe-S protein YdhL (DUF1289 family)
VRQCCLDDEDICLGCGRHLSEILAWHSADPTQRRAILDRAAQRRRQRALRRHLPDSAPPPAPLPPVDPSA